MLHVVPMKSNDTAHHALLECFKVLGQPLMIYSDDEGALSSKKVQDFFKGEGITHVVTKTHSNQAGRAVRTVKRCLVKDLAQTKTKLGLK